MSAPEMVNANGFIITKQNQKGSCDQCKVISMPYAIKPFSYLSSLTPSEASWNLPQ